MADFYEAASDDQEELLSISSASKVNSTAWYKYLDDTEEAYDLQESNQLFDLPEQNIIDDDCRKLINELKIPEEEELTTFSTLRAIITAYRINENKRYKSGNGWVALLGPLVVKKHPRLKTYNLFKSIRDIYIPQTGTLGFVTRLLLLYHDPELCSLLDTDNISLANSTQSWINALFAGVCTQPVVNLIWNFIFKHQDSFIVFFLFIAIIIGNRNEIKKMKFDTKERIEKSIESFPRILNTREIQSFLKSAEYYNEKTPPFFKQNFYSFMFGEIRESIPHPLPELLPSSALQVLENLHDVSPNLSFNYFVVDCRPLDQYQAGRLPSKNSFHIQCESVIKWTSLYLKTAVNEVLSKLKKGSVNPEAGNVEHICLMGNGLEEVDKCVQIIAEEFLKKHIRYVSVLNCGYPAIHEFARLQNKLDSYIINHNVRKCISCNPDLIIDKVEAVEDVLSEGPKEEQRKFADKVKERLKKTGQDVKRKLFSCGNPISSECKDVLEERTDDEGNLDSNAYGISNTSQTCDSYSLGAGSDNYEGFSLNDNKPLLEKDDADEEPDYQVTSLSEWTKQSNINMFKCKQVLSNRLAYKSLLIITEKRIILLRRIKDIKNNGYLIINCPLLNISKITASESKLNIITIHFDRTGIDMFLPFEKIKLSISQRKEAVQLIQKKFQSGAMN